MARSRITEQTSTTLPLHRPLERAAPAPKLLARGTSFGGPLQWALEGRGWGFLRPAVDFVLLCGAVVLALGGVDATLNAAPVSAIPARSSLRPGMRPSEMPA